MAKTLTLDGVRWPRILSFFSGIGMMIASILTIRHYFLANYPESIFEGSFCDISAFFNCDSSAFSVISQVMGVPLGFFGIIVGALVALGALFPSESFERTNSFIAFLNIFGVLALLAYSVFFMGSLCLLCTGFYVFSLLSFFLFWKYGVGRDKRISFIRFFQPSLKMLVTFACITALGAYGMIQYHDAKKDAQAAVTLRIIKQFRDLPFVDSPSIISPYWTIRSTEFFEDAPIQIIAFSDFLCPDCLFLTQEFDKLKEEFPGQINIAFQFFPLEGRCNPAAQEKDIHPGACELAFIAAYDPAQFVAIHDEIFANFNEARRSEWRQELAMRYGVEQALNDPITHDIVKSIADTGMEYEKTSDEFTYGIRSTPTMIINGRMIIGTLPYEHMRSIFQDLVDEYEGRTRFIEQWVPRKARKIKR
ncbi:MAG: thioredoxin domain-containing protein [Candidatus Aminicenantes bacterium]|nr:MAG: thioredoxin domain-containing protein [Candidatus Aminicenantes bacterium]